MQRGKRLAILLTTAFAALALAASAAAWNPWAYVNGRGQPTRGTAPQPTGELATVGSGQTTSKAKPPARKVIRSGKRCKKTKDVRTCTYYSKGRIVKVCYKKGNRKERCRKLSRALSAGAWQTGPSTATVPLTHGAGLVNHGYTNPLIPAVGRLHSAAAGGGYCSGTLIARGVVLTAGHCLYENVALAQQNGWTGTPRGYSILGGDLWFYPGQTWLAGYDLPDPRYGRWQAKDWWVTGGWANDDPSLDWGLIELYPDANGNYPGDFQGVGWFVAQANIQLSHPTRAYVVGYPATGDFSFLHNGNGQYFCDTQWDLWQGKGLVNPHLSSGTFLAYQCLVNGGASGGAVLIPLSNGSWVIGGVIQQSAANQVNGGVGAWTYASYLDHRIVEFYRSVFG